MPAPYRPLMPHDWIRLEQLINEIFGILNAETTLSTIEVTGSDIQVELDAVSNIAVANASNIVWLESDADTVKSDIVILKSDIAVLQTTAGAAAGNDTEVQYNDGGALGASPDLTFNAATSTLAVAGTTKTKRLLAGGVSA